MLRHLNKTKNKKERERSRFSAMFNISLSYFIINKYMNVAIKSIMLSVREQAGLILICAMYLWSDKKMRTIKIYYDFIMNTLRKHYG